MAHASGFVLVGKDLVIADYQKLANVKGSSALCYSSRGGARLFTFSIWSNIKLANPHAYASLAQNRSDGSSAPLIPDLPLLDQLLCPVDNSLHLNHLVVLLFEDKDRRNQGEASSPCRAKYFRCKKIVSREGIEPPTY